MIAVTVFLSGIVMTLGIVAIALRYLKSPLEIVRTDLCGTRDRARFWTAFSNVTLFLVPFVIALGTRPTAGNWQSSVFEISSQIECAVIGFIVSVLFLGLILSRYIPRTRSVKLEQDRGAS
jgi:hypothetical protein